MLSKRLKKKRNSQKQSDCFFLKAGEIEEIRGLKKEGRGGRSRPKKKQVGRKPAVLKGTDNRIWIRR